MSRVIFRFFIWLAFRARVTELAMQTIDSNATYHLISDHLRGHCIVPGIIF